ncbi:hypothetical protein TNCV_2321151 [Trichonephila clavipes]|nr:hypothetical protein TNCV_2321151 [Trichonephila clavipes]
MADILEFLQKISIYADSDEEIEMNNASLVSTSSEMRNIMKRSPMVVVGHFILELHPVRMWRMGSLTVSKVDGAIHKDKTTQYFKNAGVHKDVAIPSTKRSMFTAVRQDTLQYAIEDMIKED